MSKIETHEERETRLELNREKRLRRRLSKEGFALNKCHYTHPMAGYGGYTIIGVDGNYLAAGEKYTLSLNDVENFCNF